MKVSSRDVDGEKGIHVVVFAYVAWAPFRSPKCVKSGQDELPC